MRWTLQISNPVETRHFLFPISMQTCSVAHPACWCSFSAVVVSPGAKRPERDVYPSPCSVEVKNEWFYALCASMAWTLTTVSFCVPDYVIVCSSVPNSCVSYQHLRYLCHPSSKYHIHYFWINGNRRGLAGQSNCDGRDGISEKNISNGKSSTNWTNDYPVTFFSSVPPNSALLNLTFPPLFVNTAADPMFRLLTVSRA